MTDFILPRSLESAYAEALQLLTDGVEDPVRRCELVGIVRDYVDKLESTANRRGEKLKEIAVRAITPPRRLRVVVGRFLEDGAVFVLEVPGYDLAWLGDLVSESDVGLVLRSEQLPDVPQNTPIDFVVVDQPEPGDLVLALRVRSMGQTPDGRGEARFGVASMAVVREAPGAAP